MLCRVGTFGIRWSSPYTHPHFCTPAAQDCSVGCVCSRCRAHRGQGEQQGMWVNQNNSIAVYSVRQWFMTKYFWLCGADFFFPHGKTAVFIPFPNYFVTWLVCCPFCAESYLSKMPGDQAWFSQIHIYFFFLCKWKQYILKEPHQYCPGFWTLLHRGTISI